MTFIAISLCPKYFQSQKNIHCTSVSGLKTAPAWATQKKSQESSARIIDPALCLQDMDQMGVDIQVIYPSLIHQNTASLEGERALKLV